MNKIKLNIATRKQCTGCMACADACAKGALKIIVADDGHFYPQWNKEACVDCGLCEKCCPVTNHITDKIDVKESKPYAAWTTNEVLIKNSASGGVFAALAKYVLDAGGTVIGAASKGREVRHIAIDKIENLPLLQGSKYLQSNTQGIYKQVRSLLKDGKKVLFSGTGCQVGGLLSFLGKKYDNLITVDLVCAGVPSSFVMQRFCKEEKIEPKTIRWRDKENGWKHGLQLTLWTDNEIIKPKTATCFFWGGFLGGMTHRYSCFDCLFCGKERLSDITIADYWGVKGFDHQQYNGISVLIVHTDKAANLCERCELELHPTSWEDCIRKNPRIVNGHRPCQWMNFERKFVPYAFKHFSYATLQKIYAGNISSRDWLWLPYKIFKFCRWKISGWTVSNQTKKILKKK